MRVYPQSRADGGGGLDLLGHVPERDPEPPPVVVSPGRVFPPRNLLLLDAEVVPLRSRDPEGLSLLGVPEGRRGGQKLLRLRKKKPSRGVEKHLQTVFTCVSLLGNSLCLPHKCVIASAIFFFFFSSFGP